MSHSRITLNRPTGASTVAVNSRLANVDLRWVGDDIAPIATLTGTALPPDALRAEDGHLRLYADCSAAAPARWELISAADVPLRIDHRGRDGQFQLVGDHLPLIELVSVVQRGQLLVALGDRHPDLTAVALRAISAELSFVANGSYATLTETVIDVTSGRFRAAWDGWFPALRVIAAHLTSGTGVIQLGGQFQHPLTLDLHANNADITLDLRGRFAAPAQVAIQSKATMLRVLLDPTVPAAIDLIPHASTYRATGLHWDAGQWWTTPAPHPTTTLHISLVAQSGAIELAAGES